MYDKQGCFIGCKIPPDKFKVGDRVFYHTYEGVIPDKVLEKYTDGRLKLKSSVKYGAFEPCLVYLTREEMLQGIYSHNKEYLPEIELRSLLSKVTEDWRTLQKESNSLMGLFSGLALDVYRAMRNI